MFLKVIGAASLVLGVLLTGCTTAETPPVPEQRHEERSALEYMQDAGMLFQQYAAQKQPQQLRNAMEAITKAEALEPDNLQIKAIYYGVGAAYVTELGRDEKVLQKLHDEYPKLKAAGAGQMPPSYIESYVLREEKAPMPEIITALFQALRENDSVLQVYRELSLFLILDDQVDLAVDVAKRGVGMGYDDGALHGVLALGYYLQLHELESKDLCPIAETQLAEQGLEETLKAMRMASKQSGQLDMLAQKGYEFLGQRDMALHFAKKVYDADGDVNDYVGNLAGNGRLDEAKRLIASHESGVSLLTRAQVAFYDRKWREAAEYYQRAEKGSLHTYLKYAHSVAMSGDRDAAVKIIAEIPESTAIAPWDDHLRRYYLGELSGEALMKEATNVCRKMEALFVFGMQAWGAGEKKRARDYFEEVLQTRMYADVEYTAADYWLKAW